MRCSGLTWARACPVPSCSRWGTVWPSPLSAAWTPSCTGFVTTRVRSGSSARAAAIDQSNMGRPATEWSTLGIREFIRTPLPAASTTTVTPPRVSGEWARLDPADAFTRMGGIGADYSGRLLVASDSGGQVVCVRSPLFPDRPGSDALTQARTQSVEAPAEFVGVALHRVFDGQVWQPAPGQASKQVPGGPLRKPPRVRP